MISTSFIGLVLLMTFIGWIDSLDDKPIITYPMIHFLSQTLVLTICFLAASRNPKYAELYGPAVVGVALLVMEICNQTQPILKPESKQRQDLGIYVLVYLIYVGLLTTTFWTHLFPRIIWYSMCCTSIIRAGKINIGVTVLFFLMMLIFTEFIFYVQMKSQVKLLLASKMVKYQGQQLLEMLDSVPDKVLVCNFARDDEDLKPSPLYNNR